MPGLSITNSVIPLRPTASTWIIAPWPPPVTVTVSSTLYKLPSFEIVTAVGIPVIVALIKASSSSVAVPCRTSLVWNVPVIVSSFKINSDISLGPIWNLNTFSTIAVASEVSPVIVRPIKSAVFPVVPIALNIFWVSHLPSDTRNICSLG